MKLFPPIKLDNVYRFVRQLQPERFLVFRFSLSLGVGQDPSRGRGSTSVGTVYKRDKFGSMIQVQRIEGKLFESKEQAEQHGIELCKEWIDKQKPEFNRRVGGVNPIF